MPSASRPLFIFFAIAYTWAWLVFVPLVMFHGRPEWIVVATFGPTVAALAVHRMTTGDYRAFRIVPSWPRTIGATTLGIALVLLAYVVLPGILAADPRRLHWSVFVSAAVFDYSTLLGGPLGEEPGWRGYALPRLQATLGPVRSSLLLGLLWTGWHLPLFLYPGWISSPLWTYVLFLVGQSLLLTYGTNLANSGVVVPIAMHAAFNRVPKFLGGLFVDTTPSTPIPFDLLMALCGLAIALVIVLVTRGRMAYREASAPEHRGALATR